MTLAQVLMQHIPDDNLSDDYTWSCLCGAGGEITDEDEPMVEELWSQHVVDTSQGVPPVTDDDRSIHISKEIQQEWMRRYGEPPGPWEDEPLHRMLWLTRRLEQDDAL